MFARVRAIGNTRQFFTYLYQHVKGVIVHSAMRMKAGARMKIIG